MIRLVLLENSTSRRDLVDASLRQRCKAILEVLSEAIVLLDGSEALQNVKKERGKGPEWKSDIPFSHLN